MKLDCYNNTHFKRGRPFWVEVAWLLVQSLFVSSWIPGSRHRVMLLRLFGARIGKRVNIKPHIRVKFPWRLEISDNTWIGESCWIDNLSSVKIGSNCCISQGVYLCTGSHDWSKETFDLLTKPINIGDGVWLAAKSIVSPGVNIHPGSVLTLGSVATRDLEAKTVNQGNPAIEVNKRETLSHLSGTF